MRHAVQEELKKKVRDYWSEEPCNADLSDKDRQSKAYYDEIEGNRYRREPEIFSFAQFTRFCGQKILEAGVGMGTDFLQWVRAGAQAYGVDLTWEGVGHVRRRLQLYGLEAKGVMVADVEALPFPDNAFDLVYSWGVIHHTPDTEAALREIVRVCRPGGICKIMIYNRHSLVALYLWLRRALLAGRPWRSISWCLYHCVESPGTKAFTEREVRSILSNLSIENLRISAAVTFHDRLGGSKRPLRFAAGILSALLAGFPVGWFMTVQFTKQQRA